MFGGLGNTVLLNGFGPLIEPSKLIPVTPSANARDVPIDTTVAFQITQGDTVDLSSLVVTIAGEAAYAEGAVQPGWHGSVTPGSTISVSLKRVRSFALNKHVVVEVDWDLTS